MNDTTYCTNKQRITVYIYDQRCVKALAYFDRPFEMRVKKCLKLVLAALVVGFLVVVHEELSASVNHTARLPRGGLTRDHLYLGLDLSTQSLKYTVLDRQLRTVRAGSVNFDDALPKWQTQGGVRTFFLFCLVLF